MMRKKEIKLQFFGKGCFMSQKNVLFFDIGYRRR